MNLMELDALIWCYYVCTHCVTEEGTRIARAECEDGTIYTYIWRKGPVWHGRSAKTVLYIISGGRDPYGTGGVRRRCFISYWEEGTCMAQAECEDGAMIYI